MSGAKSTSTRLNWRAKDLSGRRFARLLVISFSRADGATHWNCLCDCGNAKTVSAGKLTSKHVRSCGCIEAENRITHGMSGSPEYTVWKGMFKRCRVEYKDRGICVCERWARFENFLADMGLRPDTRHSIDRIDNDGNYEPSNCRWATRGVQQRNRRNNRMIEYAGKRQCLADWAIEFGIHGSTLYHRIVSLRWPVETALTTPPNPGISRARAKYWSRTRGI